MLSSQKGSLENEHIKPRYILPEHTNLRGLGLVDQIALNLVLNHVKSASVESLHGKGSLDLTPFLYPDLFERLTAYAPRRIDADSILLKSYLLKNS